MVGKLHDDAVATMDALFAKEVGNLMGAPRHFREAQLQFGTVVVNDPKRRLVIIARIGIEIVECTVEIIQLRPTKTAIGSFIVFAMLEQEVARFQKFLQSMLRNFRHAMAFSHGCTPGTKSVSN